MAGTAPNKIKLTCPSRLIISIGIVGHLTIGDNVKIGAQSGIEHNIKDGEMFLGSPALEAHKTRRLWVYWRNFDDLVKRIVILEKMLKK